MVSPGMAEGFCSILLQAILSSRRLTVCTGHEMQRIKTAVDTSYLSVSLRTIRLMQSCCLSKRERRSFACSYFKEKLFDSDNLTSNVVIYKTERHLQEHRKRSLLGLISMQCPYATCSKAVMSFLQYMHADYTFGLTIRCFVVYCT